MATDTVLECVMVGPASRRRGRDFRLHQGGDRLSPASRKRLAGFAMALSQWGNAAPARPFSMLLPLAPEDAQYALFKGAYLGPGEMGPVCVAQGVLLPAAMVHHWQGRVHRVLDWIEAPAFEPWAKAHVTIDLDHLAGEAEPGGAPSIDIIANLSQIIASASGKVGLHIVERDVAAEQIQSLVIEAIPWARIGVAPAWVTARDLPSMGDFDTGIFKLVIAAASRMPEQPAESDIYTDGHSIFHGNRLVPPGWLILHALFQGKPPPADTKSVAAAHGRIEISDRAQAVLAGQRWHDDYATLSPPEVVASAIGNILGHGLTVDEFWDVLALLARNIRHLESADLQAQAALGIATLFERKASHDPATFALMLSNYLKRLWTQLPGQEEVPLRLALERGVLWRLDSETVNALLAAGLAARFPEELAAAMSEATAMEPQAAGRVDDRVAGAILASVAATVASGVPEKAELDSVAAGMSLAAALMHGSGTDASPALRDAVASLGDVALKPPSQTSRPWQDAAPGLVAAAVSAGAAQQTSFLSAHVERVRAAISADAGTGIGFATVGAVTAAAFADMLVIRELLVPDRQ